MILSHLQTRRTPLRADGPVKDLINCRPDVFDAFHPLPKPVNLVSGTRRLLGLDRRGGNDNLLSLDTSSGTLCLEGRFSSDDVFESLMEPIAEGAGDIVETASCGHFLCCRRSDSSLFFLRYDDSTSSYIAMGELPSAPVFRLARTEMAPLTFSVSPCHWSKAADDLRAEIPAEAVKQADTAVKSAWREALRVCADMDAFVQPVTVRVAARLFDGRLYSVSAPVRVPGATWRGGDRFLLPVSAGSDNRISGTGSADFSVTPYRIRLDVEPFALEVWNEVFEAIEVYVEPEQDAVKGASACSVSYSEGNRSLSVFLPLRSTRELEERLGHGPYRFCGSYGLPVSGNPELGPSTTGEEADLNTLASVSGKADRILSHGSFLHYTAGSRLLTSHTGNPLSQCSETGFGSRIQAMAALPSGGGAYTRQYLYVCTEASVFALTYDSTGRHTNCRPVSPHTVSDRRRIVSTDDAVYALSDNGCLLRLRNANPEILYRGLPPYAALLWEARSNELHLTGSFGTLVIQLSAPFRAYRRSLTSDDVVAQSGRILYISSGSLLHARPYTVYGDAPESNEEATVELTAEGVEVSSGVLKVCGAVWAPARISLSVKAQDELLVQSATSSAQLDTELRTGLAETRAEWDTNGRRQYLLPLAAGVRSPWPPTYHITIKGRWSALETPVLTELNGRFSSSPADTAGRKASPSRGRLRRRPVL